MRFLLISSYQIARRFARQKHRKDKMWRAVARLPRWWTEGEYCGDFALLVAGRGVSWQFVPHSILPKPIIKEAKFRENRLPRRRQPKIRRNHPANWLILRYFPALG